MRYFDNDSGLTSAGAGRLYSDERGNAKRIVLLVILLLVLAAAAVLLLFPDLIAPPEPEPVKVADTQVKRKVVQLPKQADATKPEAQAAAAKPEPNAAAAKPEPKAATAKPDAQTAAAKPEPKAATTKPEPKVADVKSEPKATAAKPEAQVAAAKPEPKAVTAKPEPKAAIAKPQPKPAATPTGPYTVSAGAFLLKSSVEQADAAVRKLGFTPYHSKVTRDIEVIRLREGIYGEAEARSRVAEYTKGVAPEAFVLKTAKGWSVYLGSYVGLDRARVHADRLYAEGIHVSEEKAVVPMALTMVRFGDFPDQASAAQAVAKAKAAGIEAYVSKVP